MGRAQGKVEIIGMMLEQFGVGIRRLGVFPLARKQSRLLPKLLIVGCVGFGAPLSERIRLASSSSREDTRLLL